MAQRPRATQVQDQWLCNVSALPTRIRKDEILSITVILSQPTFDGLDDDVKRRVYSDGFNFRYSTTSNELDTVLNNTLSNVRSSSATVQRTTPLARTTDVALPDIPDGDYAIDVIVTPRDVFWNDPPQGLVPPRDTIVGSTTISVITTLVQTDSRVTLQRTFAGPTSDRALWPAIRNRTAAIGFDRYKRFIDCIFCDREMPENLPDYMGGRCVDPGVTLQLNIHGPYAYSILKFATQLFLTLESGVVIRDTSTTAAGRPPIFDILKERIRVNDFSLTVQQLETQLQRYLGPTERLPYLNRILTNLITLDGQNIDEVIPYCLGVLQYRLTSPSLIELIWSYWHEEGMLVQTMNAIARRFQNRRGSPNDPLGELEFDPLRPLNNVIWGFIQDEHNRLTVPRRAHEYQHHYGLSLIGTAVSDLNPADSRSKFIEAFHNLLSCAARFFQADSDTTVIADAFPLLNALKEVHLILAEGAHNQFGDLTWTARAEMLTIQWMLARPEMKEFLRGRYMVPYQEEWMGAVDSMKKLQGWTDTTITHFYELAVTGERILLSIRYGDWSDIENIEDQAKNWARSWKPELQRYIHAYRTATGVDLAAEVIDTRDAATRYLQPSVLLQRRLAEQMSAMPPRLSRAPELVAARVSGQAAQAALPRPGRHKLPVYRKET
jgi:hypothetical protein